MILTLVQSDTGSLVRVACHNFDTDRTPITVSTAKIKYRVNGGERQVKDMTVVGANLIEYLFTADDLQPGAIAAEVMLIDGLGRELTSMKKIDFIVRGRL